MQYFVFVYMVVFALQAIAMCAGELLADPAERDPMWETVCDSAATGIFFAGMVFFVIGVKSQPLKSAWLVLAPIAAAYVVFSSIRARNKQRKDSGSGLKRSHFVLADIGTIAFVLPAFAINLLFSWQ